MASATPQSSTWCSVASGHDLVEVQGGARGVDEIVARAVDQPDSTQPHEGVVRVFRRDVFVGAVADKLAHRLRPLIVRVEQPMQDAPIVGVVRFDRWVRLLCGHGAGPPCSRSRRQLALSSGPLVMDASQPKPKRLRFAGLFKLRHFRDALDNVCYVN